MKNILFIVTLAVALGLIAFLFQRLNATEIALKEAQQHFTDCEQVTFQLQNQLSEKQRGATAAPATAPQK
jgi:CHASE3 domain sensor protein